MTGWRDYYGADGHLSRSRHRTIGAPVDDEFAARLGTTALGLLEAGVGTTFFSVGSVLVGDEFDAEPDRVREWFVHGDPWSVLVGIGRDHVLVGSVDLWRGGLAGPPAIHLIEAQTPLPLAGLDLVELAAQVDQAFAVTSSSWWTCPLCRSIRYGEGCTCDSYATGVIYD